jgi:HEAT repeat protein
MDRSRIWRALLGCSFLGAAPACLPLRGDLLEPGRDPAAKSDDQALADDPWATSTSVRDPEPAVRAQTVRRLSEDPAAWTAEVVALLDDEHPQVRIAALESLPPNVPAATDHLIARLRDPDIAVRLVAIAAAGRSQLPAAQDELRKLAEARGEAVRAAAVAALAVAGDREFVRAAVADKAWQVRLEVARRLSLWPNRAGQQLARQLLSDPAPAIRIATVQAIGAWPADLAAPLWLEALEPGPRAARADRREAARLLAERWPPAAALSAEALLNDRSTGHQAAIAKLGELRTRWRQEHPRAEPAHPQPAAADPRADSSADRALAEACLATLSSDESTAQQEQALERLRTLGDRLGPTLAAVSQTRGELPESVFRAALAQDPVHRDLVEFAEGNLAQRRAAAIRLLHAARQAPLDELALGRLETLTLRADDPFLWQTSLDLVADDRRESALRLMLAAASHPEGDLREAACTRLGRTRDSRFAPVLRAALDDPDARVVAAAAVALGHCGAAGDAPLLEGKLQSSRPEVRLAAAEGLAQLSPESGLAALERLALDRRAVVRQRAAEAMGRTADTQLAAALIARLDDEAAVRRAALVSLRQLAPEAAAEITPAGQGTATEAQEIAAWRAWKRDGADATGVSAPP